MGASDNGGAIERCPKVQKKTPHFSGVAPMASSYTSAALSRGFEERSSKG